MLVLWARVCQDERCECGYINLGVDAMTAILRYLVQDSPYHNKGTEEMCIRLLLVIEYLYYFVAYVAYNPSVREDCFHLYYRR